MYLLIKFVTVLFLFSWILLTASQHVPKSPEYLTTTGHNTAGKVPQNTEKLLDLLLLFPLPVSPTAKKGAHCKATTALSSVPVILITTSTLEELAFQWSVSIPTDSSLPLSYYSLYIYLITILYYHSLVPLHDYFCYPNLQLAIRGKSSVPEIEPASLLPAVLSEQCGWQGTVPGHSRLLCRVQEAEKNSGSADLVLLTGGLSLSQQEGAGAKGGNPSRAKGRQLKIHICVKLEWGRAHTCRAPQLSHPVHTQRWEWCVVQVQLFIYLCLCL